LAKPLGCSQELRLPAALLFPTEWCTRVEGSTLSRAMNGRQFTVRPPTASAVGRRRASVGRGGMVAVTYPFALPGKPKGHGHAVPKKPRGIVSKTHTNILHARSVC